MKQLVASLLLAFGLCGNVVAQAPQASSAPADQRMQWFEDARLGIFIHWGIYAAHGTSESW